MPHSLLRIVADDYVDRDFGSGAVKLTPAHDFNDYNLGKKHGLEFINILNDDGTLNANAGPKFQGQKRFDARYTVVDALKNMGLFVKQESHAMKIPRCLKTKDIIEPLIKPQWWMQMREMADAALEVVKNGDLKIAPASAARSYERWMTGIQDWCLSRQLWWGHQIPAYKVLFEDASADQDEEHWVVERSQAEAVAQAEKQYPGRKFRLERDPDCLEYVLSDWPSITLTTQHLVQRWPLANGNSRLAKHGES